MSKLIKLGKEEVLREDWESTPGSVRELVKKLVQENEELRACLKSSSKYGKWCRKIPPE